MSNGLFLKMQQALCSCLGNNSRAFRKFWEFYLCFVIRGKALVFEFEALKVAQGND